MRILGILAMVVVSVGNAKVYEMKVTGRGFEPSSIEVTKGESVQLLVTRTEKKTCATEIQFPDLKIKKDLPLNKVVKLDLGKVEGETVSFGCGMDMMMGGVITVK